MSDNLQLRVKVTGEGTPLLLVPGGLTGWVSWEPFVDDFTKKHRKVIMVQLLNVDSAIENSQLPDDYSLKTESRALGKSVDSLGIEGPLDIVGWSYGGLTSLDYALGNTDKVRTLTLIEPPAIWVLRSSGKLDGDTRAMLQFFDSFDDEITEDQLAKFLQFVGFAKPGTSVRSLPQWEQWLPFRQSLRNNPAVANHNDELSRLKKFKKPVLLIKGTGSALFLHKIIDELALNLPEAKVIEMPSGHAPHIVSRDQFLRRLEDFQNNHLV